MRSKLENLNRPNDEVEMRLNLTLVPCLVVRINMLVRFTHILTNKQVSVLQDNHREISHIKQVLTRLTSSLKQLC